LDGVGEIHHGLANAKCLERREGLQKVLAFAWPGADFLQADIRQFVADQRRRDEIATRKRLLNGFVSRFEKEDRCNRRSVGDLICRGPRESIAWIPLRA
jgi:hypothetical protein